MTDLLSVLPNLPTTSFGNIIPSLERNHITVADLLTLDAVDVAKRAQLPAREIRRLTGAVLEALHLDLSPDTADTNGPKLASTGTGLAAQWSTISLLDDTLDAALGGGIPTGYITEIVGESGAGKTQLLLTLLLAVQLPPSEGGLARSAIYISTEAPLQTSRLSQMLTSHPLLSRIDDQDEQKPTLGKILSIQTPDLESQEHILRYQLPIAVRRHNVGIVVIDSITANYRAEFARDNHGAGTGGTGNTSGAAAMAKRTAQLLEVATLLRNLARTENLAVVVANQVADRFDAPPIRQGFPQQDANRPTTAQTESLKMSQDSPASSSGGGTTSASMDELVTLDHQQRFFTGWGDARPGWSDGNAILSGPGHKTPSLGLVWANQIAARIALVKSYARNVPASSATRTLRELETHLLVEEITPVLDRHEPDDVSSSSRWKRHLKVVFAPWVASSDGYRGVEVVIWKGGVKAVTAKLLSP